MFIDGFGAMGFRRATTAIKASSLIHRSGVRTIMEWRGDEKTLHKWLPSFQILMGATTFTAKFVIVDQKCAHYFLKTRGSGADDCFMFSNEVTRTLWKDMLIGAPGLPGNAPGDPANTLKYRAGIINPEILEYVPWLGSAIVVPPMFHLLQHIREYTFETFSFNTRIKESLIFDKLCATEVKHPNIYPHTLIHIFKGPNFSRAQI